MHLSPQDMGQSRISAEILVGKNIFLEAKKRNLPQAYITEVCWSTNTQKEMY